MSIFFKYVWLSDVMRSYTTQWCEAYRSVTQRTVLQRNDMRRDAAQRNNTKLISM